MVMNFGTLLKHYRERKQLTLEEVGAKSINQKGSNLTKGYLSSVENNRISPPPLETCESIADALGLSDKEKKEFFKAAFTERNKDKDSGYKDKLGITKLTDIENLTVNPIPLKDTKIPVVSMVKGDDEMGFEFETLDPNEYEYIDFTNCKAVKITTNSMAPLAFKGQKIIYCEDQSVQDGDLVFIGLKSGEQYFKRYCKNRGKTITLEPLNIIHYRSMTIKENDVSFLYKVVGVKF